MSDNITVHVRSPSLQETLEISIAEDASIESLKQEIQRVHPQHPLPADQRIIYSGKLLDNKNQIETLLKKSEENVTPTFHLVVKPSSTSFSTSTSSSSRETVNTNNNNNTNTPLSQTAIPDTQTQAIPEPQVQTQINNLPQYPPLLPGGYQVVFLNGQYYLAPVLVPSIQPAQIQPEPQYVPTYTHEYIPEIGHRYTRQEPQPNLQPYTHQAQPQVQQQQQQQQPQPQFQPQVQAQPQFQPQFQPQAQAQQRQLQPQAIIRNIAGFLRPAANGQLAGNIWLAIKLYFMIFILSQGASLERILLFHALALVLFLYQTGRLRVVVHRARQPQTVPTTTFQVIKRGIYMFFMSFWPSFNQDQQRTE